MTAERTLRAMLPRLDAALECALLRMRARYQLSLDELRGLYVSDALVDQLLYDNGLATPEAAPLPRPTAAPLWADLARGFALDPLDQDVLLAVLAPAIDARYAAIYAYLNDSAIVRQATPQLLLRVLAADWDARAQVRRRLEPGSRLLASGLMFASDDQLACPAIVATHLLGGDALAAACASPTSSMEAAAGDVALTAYLPMVGTAEGSPILLLAGRPGSGRRAWATRLAAAVSRPLAEFRGGDLAQTILACRLTGAALYVPADAPLSAEHAALLGASPIVRLVATRDASAGERALREWATITVPFGIPGPGGRRDLWRDALRTEMVSAAPAAIEAVSARFRLPARAIRQAARDVRLTALAPPGSKPRATAEALIAAGRKQCALDLGNLATRVEVRPGWDELVLPTATRQQLRELAGAAAERDRVYEDWGMAGVGRATGRGVAALFAGASGTGKTMGAAVIARSVGLDLWRIDLSAVVSKYIGETEKNLERIFEAARDGDAILFFDEADALFGKRTEVHDAHDRYANVEVAYLLQRLEEHDGVAILASNFMRNIDQAFMRRLHYIVEFPLPDERLREQLWRKAFARDTPLESAIDFAFLANGFPLAGGDIRSAALDAAFLAASNGGLVTMPYVLRAVSRQLLKQGKLPNPRDFGRWGHAIGLPAGRPS